MRELTIDEFQFVEGRGVVVTAALLATAGWLWSNRGALNDIAEGAFEKMSELEAEDREQN